MLGLSEVQINERRADVPQLFDLNATKPGLER